jgi:hypothetical protein
LTRVGVYLYYYIYWKFNQNVFIPAGSYPIFGHHLSIKNVISKGGRSFDMYLKEHLDGKIKDALVLFSGPRPVFIATSPELVSNIY